MATTIVEVKILADRLGLRSSLAATDDRNVEQEWPYRMERAERIETLVRFTASSS
jgi:hypothetical protein